MLGGAGTLYVFSDFQKSNWETVSELPAHTVCHLRPVAETPLENVALTAAYLPGTVLTSGLSGFSTNATWLIVDGAAPETMEAVSKLYLNPTIITSDLGGLEMGEPLHSKSIQRMARQGSATSDLPMTEAEPGFIAEATAVTTTVIHNFPTGRKQPPRSGLPPGNETGTLVRAKLFAPRNRTLQSINGVRVLEATDDKGREVRGLESSAGTEVGESLVNSGGRSRPGNFAPVLLRLQLPEPDAQSIEELVGEAIAVTTGRWKELTLTNVTADTTNELDLGTLIPEAKLIITRYRVSNERLNIHARLTGPPSIRRLELQIGSGKVDQGDSSTSEQNFTTRHGQAKRALQLQRYDHQESDGPDAPAGSGAISLLIRYPEDQRRDRVHFVLRGLDLL